MNGTTVGHGSGKIALEFVECNPSIHCTLLQCPHHSSGRGNCENVGVRCEQKIVKSVSAANVTTPNYSSLHTVLINVTLAKFNSNINLFQVVCYNQRHGVYLTNSVSNKTNSFTALLTGLYPSSMYTCCTSTSLQYCQQFIARGACIDIETPAQTAQYN